MYVCIPSPQPPIYHIDLCFIFALHLCFQLLSLKVWKVVTKRRDLDVRHGVARPRHFPASPSRRFTARGLAPGRGSPTCAQSRFSSYGKSTCRAGRRRKRPPQWIQAWCRSGNRRPHGRSRRRHSRTQRPTRRTGACTLRGPGRGRGWRRRLTGRGLRLRAHPLARPTPGTCLCGGPSRCVT